MCNWFINLNPHLIPSKKKKKWTIIISQTVLYDKKQKHWADNQSAGCAEAGHCVVKQSYQRRAEYETSGATAANESDPRQV